MTSFPAQIPTTKTSPLCKALTAVGLPWPWAILIGLALIAQLALIWTHAPWADELQATALARESHSVADLYWNFRYEGHAPLWHLLLKIPLAFTEDPTALKIVQTFVVLCSAALLHLRAPFSAQVKFLLSLNYFLFFEYGVIARDYSLTVLFFFGGVAFRRQSLAWLFIALLPQGGLQSIMLAGICGLLVLREQGWRWGGALLAGSGGLVALVWIWPAPDFGSLDTLLSGPWQERLAYALYHNGATLLPVDMDLQLTGWGPSATPYIILLAGVLAPILAIFSLTGRSPVFALLAGLFILASFTLSMMLYALSSRHFGLWVVLLVGLLWTQHKPGAPTQGVALLWILMLALGGAGAGVRQIMTPFSASADTAQALQEESGQTTLIIPAFVLLGAEVNGMLRIPTFDMAGQCMQSFVRWRRNVFMPPPPDEASLAEPQEISRKGLADLKSVAARAGGRALLMLDFRVSVSLTTIDDPALSFVRIIGTRSPEMQRRYLYRLDVPPDPHPVPIPPCIR